MSRGVVSAIALTFARASIWEQRPTCPIIPQFTCALTLSRDSSTGGTLCCYLFAELKVDAKSEPSGGRHCPSKLHRQRYRFTGVGKSVYDLTTAKTNQIALFRHMKERAERKLLKVICMLTETQCFRRHRRGRGLIYCWKTKRVRKGTTMI